MRLFLTITLLLALALTGSSLLRPINSKRVKLGHHSTFRRNLKDPTYGSRTTLYMARNSSPFRLKDPLLLIGEFLSIAASQIILQLYYELDSPEFPGWMTPLSYDVEHLTAMGARTALFWLSWLVVGLNYRIYESRFPSFKYISQLIDATSQQWIGNCNIYIAVQLAVSVALLHSQIDVNGVAYAAGLEGICLLLWRYIYIMGRPPIII